MDIIHCLDDNYVPFCITAIESLCQNNSGLTNYHIISTSLSQKNKDIIRDLIINKYHHRVTFYDVDYSLIKNCPINKGSHVSLAAYLRILIPKILPQNISNALYLDCDLVVCDDISPLFSLNLDNYVAAAVYDGGTDDIRTYNRLQYSPKMGYFNTGVLLLNLNYWREHNLTERLFEFIAKHPERLLFWDQDAINSVLAGKIKRLPFKYNMTDPFYQINPPLRQEYLDEIEQVLAHPVILHFATSAKPWLSKDTPHPLKSLFYQYLAHTQWDRQYPLKPSIKKKIISLIEQAFGLCITKRKKFKSYRSLDSITHNNHIIKTLPPSWGG